MAQPFVRALSVCPLELVQRLKAKSEKEWETQRNGARIETMLVDLMHKVRLEGLWEDVIGIDLTRNVRGFGVVACARNDGRCRDSP